MMTPLDTTGRQPRIPLRNRFLAKIHEINRRYAMPRIQTSRGVTFALLLLRAYLIVLLAILFFKFASLIF